MPALNPWGKDAFYPCQGSRKLCGSADRPGRSRSPLPASPPLTPSQSNLLIYNFKVCVPAGGSVPRTDKHLSRAEARRCKRGGKGCWREQWELSPGLLAHDSFSYSSSWSVFHPHLYPSPFPWVPSFLSLPSLCSACLSVPYFRLQQRGLPGWLSR